jgi:hypothetical protein
MKQIFLALLMGVQGALQAASWNVLCSDGYEDTVEEQIISYFPTIAREEHTMRFPCPREQWLFLKGFITTCNTYNLDAALQELASSRIEDVVLLLYLNDILADRGKFREAVRQRVEYTLIDKIGSDTSLTERFINALQRCNEYGLRKERCIDEILLEHAVLQQQPETSMVSLSRPVFLCGPISNMRLSTNVRYAAGTYLKHNSVYIWDLQTGALRATIPPGALPVAGELKQAEPRAFAWSKDDTCFARSSDDGTIEIWETTSWKKIDQWRDTAAVHSLDWSPDNVHLISGNISGEVALWDAVTGELLERRQLAKKEYKKEADGVWAELPKKVSVAWSPNGTKWAAITEDRLYIVDWETNACTIQEGIYHTALQWPERHSCCDYTLRWSPTSEYIAINTSCSDFSLYNLTENRFLEWD